METGRSLGEEVWSFAECLRRSVVIAETQDVKAAVESFDYRCGSLDSD